MRVVVTGGAGFIGANLCARLSTRGGPFESVVAFDNLSTGSRDNLKSIDGVEILVGDILDPEALGSALAGAQAVVHLAARPSVPKSIKDPFASHEANATGTVRVLEAMRAAGVGHVITASSSSVYGDNPLLPKHEGLVPTPRSPYAASKLAMEAYTLAYGPTFGIESLVFRFFNVFGPLQPAGHAYAAVIPAFVSSALSGRALSIDGDGTQTRDFTFVDSVTAAIADALVRRVSCPHPVNLAFGTRQSLLDVVNTLERVLGTPLEREHRPSRPGDVHDSQADCTVLEGLFSHLDPVPFEKGLRCTVEWFMTQVDQGEDRSSDHHRCEP